MCCNEIIILENITRLLPMQLCQLITCQCSTLAHDHELSHTTRQPFKTLAAGCTEHFLIKHRYLVLCEYEQLQQQSIVNYKRKMEIAKYGEHMHIYIISVGNSIVSCGIQDYQHEVKLNAIQGITSTVTTNFTLYTVNCTILHITIYILVYYQGQTISVQLYVSILVFTLTNQTSILSADSIWLFPLPCYFTQILYGCYTNSI